MKKSKIIAVFLIVLGIQFLQPLSWAEAVVLGELTTTPGLADYQYGPAPGTFLIDLSELPSGTLAQKFIKIANDIEATGDPANAMPEFEVKLERDPENDGTFTVTDTKVLNAEFTGIATNFYNIRLQPDPALGGDFASEKVYTITITAPDGGWAVDQPETAKERIRIGIKNNAADNRTYFGALGDTTAEAEVPRIKIVSDSIDFGEVLIGLEASEIPKENLRIANVGTGTLTLSNVGDPAHSAFSHPGVSTPYSMQPLATPLNIPISFNPKHSSVTTSPAGPINTTMTISNDSTNDPSLDAPLTVTAVKLEFVMLYDVSGSMALTPEGTETTNPAEQRLGQAKQAGSQIKSLLEELDGQAVHAGLVTFPRPEYRCEVDGPTAFTKIPGPGNITNVGLDQLSAVGGQFDDAFGTGVDSLQTTYGIGIYTPLAEGLKIAHGTGTSNFGTTRWTEGEYVRRALLLLSDGAHSTNCNSAPPRRTADDWVDHLETTTIPETRKIRIFTIPYGIPSAGHVDRDTLQDLAEATGGGMYYADALDFGALKRQFRKALIEWRSDWNETVDPNGSLTKGGPTTSHDVCIDDSVYRIAFVVDWDKMSPSAINFVLEGPDGVVSPSSTDVSCRSGKNYALYIVKGDTAKGNVGSDQWTLKLTGGAGLASGETIQYSYSVITKSKVTLNTRLVSQPFYTLKDRLFEVKIKGLKKKLAKSANVTLRYDIPKESYGTWLSSMNGFDPQWLVGPKPDIDPRPDTDPQMKSSKIQNESSLIPSALAQETKGTLFAPDTIMGEPATMVQQKVYALANFAKRPFKNQRSTGEVQLFDDGTYGDKVAADGIYSAYLPALEYDGLARFGAFLNVDSDKDCLNRELRIDKLIRVALEPDIMAKNIVFKVADSTPFFPPELMKIIKEPVPEGFKRKNVVFAPQDKKGNLWGPGKANKIKFAVKNAEALGPVVDNLDGSYIQVIQYKKGDVLSVTVSARGVTTSDIPMPEKPFKISPFLWILLAILILLVIIILIRRRP